MNRGIAFAVVLMIGCASGVSVRDLVVPARAQNQIGPTYQYSSIHVLFSNDDIQRALDKYADQGWRLSNAVSAGSSIDLIFERQVSLPAR